ncbi:ATP-binding protein [Streptomyces sp. NPDC015125]|uniref:ATP-binding protein n=1 Tax=Streptomyces sp. NPDC015125 TaxID=3364938 RepID=UPI0037002F11
MRPGPQCGRCHPQTREHYSPDVIVMADIVVKCASRADGTPDCTPVTAPAPCTGVNCTAWPLTHRSEAAKSARQLSRSTLDGWRVGEDAAASVLLVVSELVTNSVQHARPPLVLHIHREHADGHIWIGITDGGPAARKGAWTASCEGDEHGRGLVIIGSLAIAHGTLSHARGTTRWARLPATT